MGDNSYAERKRRDKVDRVMGCLAAVAIRTDTERAQVHTEWLQIVATYLDNNDPAMQRAITALERAAHLPHSMGRGSLELLRATLTEALAAAGD